MSKPVLRGSAATPVIAGFSVPLRKDGTLGTAQQFPMQRVQTPPSYLRPSDRMILRLKLRPIAAGRVRWGGWTWPAVIEATARPRRTAG